MFQRSTSRRHPNTLRQGATAVEFAIVAIPIFLFVFACLEFCRILMCMHSLEEGARAGVRSAVLEVASNEGIRQDIDEVLRVSGIKKYKVETVPEDVTTVERFDPVTVRISANFGDVSWLPMPRFVSQLTLKATSTLPAEHGTDN